jgi:hypothetical protein
MLLSATGGVDPADPSLPSEGLVPFGVNAGFWSDGASKERWRLGLGLAREPGWL